MNKLSFILLLCISIARLTSCQAQPTFGEHYLTLEKTVSLPGVRGRIDHMDVNLKKQLIYVAALGNNSLEVIDIKNGKLVHSIKGLDEPQGVTYIPQTNELLVANGGNGDCIFFNGDTFEKITTLHLPADADDVRYDSLRQKIYVGYGEGGIAEIDAMMHQLTSDVKLPAHPEGFQIDQTENLLLANVPDKHQITAIDLNRHKIVNTWTREAPTSNFPMAIDTISHRAFIGYRHPARLEVLDTRSGAELSKVTIVGDADDLYFDQKTRRIYVSGGDGYINIFQLKDDGSLSQIANILTRSGARTSLFIPPLGIFVLALRASSGQPAQVNIYKTSA